MSIRDEYEILKSELVVKLTETNMLSDLIFPYNFTIPEEEEKRYLLRGLETRTTTQRANVILDNTYKKCRLLPSKETAKDFIKIQNEILADYKKKVIKSFQNEEFRFLNDDKDSFAVYIDSLIERIKEASKPYIEKLKTMTEEDVEKEIADKNASLVPFNIYNLD